MSTAVVNATVLSFTVLAVWTLLGIGFWVWLQVVTAVARWWRTHHAPTIHTAPIPLDRP